MKTTIQTATASYAISSLLTLCMTVTTARAQMHYLETKLTASDAAEGDWFGGSVGIDGDTVIVGAIRVNDLGSAYLYDAITGNELAKLTATEALGGDDFGISVAISGDVGIVGTGDFEEHPGYRGFGAAYLFGRNQGGNDNWGEIVKLTASDASADDYFGEAVAISGDTVIAGAIGYDDDGSLSGSGYIFERNHGGPDNWGEVLELTASDASGDDIFGYSVGISHNVVVMGAFGDDNGRGSAYLFSSVPEPRSIVMMIAGLTGIASFRRPGR
jgi:hypothetical protein